MPGWQASDHAELVAAADIDKAVAEGLPSPVPPEQSLQVMTILDGIYRSQELGKEVQLEEIERIN